MPAHIVGDLSAVRKAAEALTFAPPVVTPKMTEQIVRVLSGIIDRNTERFTELVKGIQLPMLDSLRLATQFAPRMAETFAHLKMRPEYVEGIRDALEGVSVSALSGLAPKTAAVVAEAVALAETPAAEEVVADALTDFDDLTASEQRELYTDCRVTVDGELVLGPTREGHRSTLCCTYHACFAASSWRVSSLPVDVRLGSRRM